MLSIKKIVKKNDQIGSKGPKLNDLALLRFHFRYFLEMYERELIFEIVDSAMTTFGRMRK